MGRPRKWESDAERKKAERNQALRDLDAVPEAEREPKAPESDTKPFEPTEAESAEKAYVRMQLAQTRAHMATFTAPEKTSKEAVTARLVRAEEYARWRWAGHQSGEISSL